MVRTKLKCESKMITDQGSQIKLTPVLGGSAENDAFFKWTPSGSVELGIVNQETAERFVPGKFYYVDFSPAD